MARPLKFFNAILRVAGSALFLFFLPAAACADDGRPAPTLPLTVLDRKPHDPAVYTQGLFFHQGLLYESSGLYGRSAFLAQTFADGPAPGKRLTLPGDVFAEGAALAEGEIYLLSWQNGRGWALDPDTLAVKREFTYAGEGWGLTFDGRTLWRSTGGAELIRHRPGDFAEIGTPLRVHDAGRPVPYLNELEWDAALGLILANIFTSNRVAAIDPRDGRVKFWLDAAPLAGRDNLADLPGWAAPREAVLNGLALAPDGRSLWLTGKFWNAMYQAAWPPPRPTF